MPETQTVLYRGIGIDHAHRLIEKGRDAADRMGLRAVFAVLDAGANMVAFVRMDGAWLASHDLAVAKARTAVMFQSPSEALSTPVQPGQPLPHFDHISGLLLMGGGMPVFDEAGVLIGGIGVSGGTPDQDAEVARAAFG